MERRDGGDEGSDRMERRDGGDEGSEMEASDRVEGS